MSKPLPIRPGAIGDFIVSLPALEALTVPGQYTEVWCAEQNVPFLRDSPNRARSIGSVTGSTAFAITHADDVVVGAICSGFDEIIS